MYSRSRALWFVGLLLAGWSCFGPSPRAFAQRAPRIGYVHPAGGQRGTEFEITLGGQFLDGADELLFSGTGLKATVLKHKKPLNGKRMTELREYMQKAREEYNRRRGPGGRRGPQGALAAIREIAIEMGADREGLDAFEEFQRQRRDPKFQLNPQLSETVTLRVEAAKDASTGWRELRLIATQGVSNPLRFHVGDLPEYRETEPNDEGPDADVSAPLPMVLNGQIMPGDVDRFAFEAKKGAHLVVVVDARRLMPYLADAVPGWFQATVALYDADGNEVAYADDDRFDPDPVLHYRIPKDGRYVVEIKDAIHRGRDDFVYRITLGELPRVDRAFPLGVRRGVKTTVALTGWNLPKKSVDIEPNDANLGIRALLSDFGAIGTDSLPLAIDELPEVVEQEPNDTRETAIGIGSSVIVNGRIDRPGDRDLFRFEGREGGRVSAEVLARRLRSPLDSVLRLIDNEGRVVSENDDHEDKGEGLLTHHADSRLLCTLPRTGTYYLELADVQGNGGHEYAYRLRVGARQPNFELRVVPSTISALRGENVPITVYALRKDGFSGEIRLALQNPAGFRMDGARIPADCDQVRLTLGAPTRPPEGPLRLVLEGRAVVGGRDVTREAVPADDMMQAFLYRHLVPAKEWIVVVAPRGWRSLPVTPRWDSGVKLVLDASTPVRMGLPERFAADKVEAVLSDPPEGITVEKASRLGRELRLMVRADSSKVKPGFQGNLIVNVFTERRAPGNNSGQGGAKRRVPLGTLPAIPFEAVESDAPRDSAPAATSE
ncbi:MAG: peptidase [Pirellulaceae bacterium]|nr:peptidase [Pirellulaceae bacterium]